ncbi:hypothetical protein CBI57_08620 [Pantoea agglomerans]|nr:hypothetical protein CBI57_08620 [Pantoea agglomerans]
MLHVKSEAISVNVVFFMILPPKITAVQAPLIGIMAIIVAGDICKSLKIRELTNYYACLALS